MKVFGILLLGLTAISAAPTEVLTSFSLLSNQVTADIYKEYHENAEKNFVVCPLSVEILLALVQAGAGGNTADELTKALRLPQKRDAIDEIYRELHPTLKANGKYTLETANKIYIRNGFEVTDHYKTTAVDVFGASIRNIDFGNKKAAVAEINGWVSDNTHHKIRELITEDQITQETRAVLLNAVYFKGKWQKEFPKANTKKRHFYVTQKSYVDVDTMDQTNHFRYFRSSALNARFIELPYEGDNITMTIVLPDSKDGLAALEERIHEVVVEPLYIWQRVHLRLPKNKISSTIEFNPILKKLGIAEAFTKEADFTKMLTATNEALYINTVKQKALIETDEEGTVATAVTGAIMVTTLSRPLPPPPPINFYANHPFIFFLKHKESGIFFIGRYSQPAGAEHPTTGNDEDS